MPGSGQGQLRRRNQKARRQPARPCPSGSPAADRGRHRGIEVARAEPRRGSPGRRRRPANARGAAARNMARHRRLEAKGRVDHRAKGDEGRSPGRRRRHPPAAAFAAHGGASSLAVVDRRTDREGRRRRKAPESTPPPERPATTSMAGGKSENSLLRDHQNRIADDAAKAGRQGPARGRRQSEASPAARTPPSVHSSEPPGAAPAGAP